MLSDTLNEGLSAYRIGAKIRALRLEKGLALAQLGVHTGLSAGMLSKIENGQIFPTLPTLLRIALVFGLGLDHFFAPGEDKPLTEVIRRADRLRLPDRPQGKPAYFFESLDYPVQGQGLRAYLARFPEAAPASAPHAHAGVELVHVIEGSITILIHGKTHLLETGDTMYFDAAFDHCYQAAGTGEAQAIVALAGPEN